MIKHRDRIIILATLTTCLYSCQPKPLEIEVTQSPATLTVSAAAPDNHTVLVSACYSFNSLLSLTDTATGGTAIPENILLKDAVITLTGNHTDTLTKVVSGVYGKSDLTLENGRRYTLNIYDLAEGKTTTATTTYHLPPEVASITPVVRRKYADTTIDLNIQFSSVASEHFYFISYHSSVSARAVSNSPQAVAASLASFSAKQLTLFTAAQLNETGLRCSIPMTCKASDTLLVHIGEIDRDYYDYLTAYKKSGSFINQLSGEPINLPTNVLKGLGFFALSQPARYVFRLKEL